MASEEEMYQKLDEKQLEDKGRIRYLGQVEVPYALIAAAERTVANRREFYRELSDFFESINQGRVKATQTLKF